MSIFNPFSGLGKIDSFVKWATFRGLPSVSILKRSIAKFGSRWGKRIKSAIGYQEQLKQVAYRLKRSGPNRSLETLTLAGGKNKAKTVRISGEVKNSKFRTFGAGRSSSRAFIVDVPRSLTKRQMQRTIREQILDAFFDHYDIASKYKPDFRKRFGDIDVIDIEGV